MFEQFASGDGLQPEAWVQNGRLYLQHQKGGPYPLLQSCPGLELLINGKRVTGTTVVNKDDRVELHPVSEEVKGSWQLEVTSDKQVAYISIIPRTVIERQVADLPPGSLLQLAVTEQSSAFSPASINEILNLLQQQGIVYGIDWSACQEASQCTETREIVVARGTIPLPGKNARIQVLFDQVDKTPVQVVVDEQDNLDYRQRFIYTSVAAGAVLARKAPMSPGKPGQDVYGNLVMPANGRDMELVVGQGVTLSNDGLEVIALRSGRPVAGQKGNKVLLAVLDLLEINGHVGLETGNINYHGDVHIAGNVNEGMQVKAGGGASIMGYVTEASLQAGGPVLIRGNVLASTVMAGGTPLLVNEIGAMVKHLRSRLAELLQALNQLQAHPGLVKVGPVLQLLLEGKFQDLPSMVKMLAKTTELLPAEFNRVGIIGFCQQLVTKLIQTPLAVKDTAPVKYLLECSQELEASIGEAALTPADLVVSYVQNCTLMATGNVQVTGSGSYNSKIWAGGRIIITNHCRGGSLKAVGDTWIGELGTPAGVVTAVKVAAAASVTIKLAWENTQVEIGDRIHYIKQTEKNIRLFLDQDGILQVTRLTSAELEGGGKYRSVVKKIS